MNKRPKKPKFEPEVAALKDAGEKKRKAKRPPMTPKERQAQLKRSKPSFQVLGSPDRGQQTKPKKS